jgi:hypothetical protein
LDDGVNGQEAVELLAFSIILEKLEIKTCKVARVYSEK